MVSLFQTAMLGVGQDRPIRCSRPCVGGSGFKCVLEILRKGGDVPVVNCVLKTLRKGGRCTSSYM